jgi:hypothetical protein
MIEIQNSKQIECLRDIESGIEMFWSRAAQALAPRVGIWNFDIVWNLSIVIWDFSAVFAKGNRM